jgi:hypothetical protein
MAKQYIHLDGIDTLAEYESRLDEWVRKLDEISSEMQSYHESLERDKRWYGESYEDFQECFVYAMIREFLQPAVNLIESECRPKLHDFRARAEELGIR